MKQIRFELGLEQLKQIDGAGGENYRSLYLMHSVCWHSARAECNIYCKKRFLRSERFSIPSRKMKRKYRGVNEEHSSQMHRINI